MKKLLFILITIPLIFNSCKKEEEVNQTNNNSNLTIEQTIWEVSSFQFNNNNGQTGVEVNIPCGDEDWDTGINKIEWTFFNNEGYFVEKWVDGYNGSRYDTSNYFYFPNQNIITLNDYSQDGDGNFFGGSFDCQSIDIINHSSTNLEINFFTNSGYLRIYLTIK